MSRIVCPICGTPNSEFNPRCSSCDTPLPASTTGGSSVSGFDSPSPGSLALEDAALEDAALEGAPRPDLVGSPLAQYRVDTLLGRGGMGDVYKAWDLDLERAVALKVIRPDRAAKAEYRERFRREARAAGQLDHPAVVRIFEVLELDEGDCIVMELVEGKTLAEMLEPNRPLDLVLTVSLARDVAQGLAEAHARGIIHRDLKVENIMVTAAGHAKILDFGLAKRLSLLESEDHTPSSEFSLTVDGGVVGTYRAMSPEQAQGFPVDGRSDLFSVGTLLYESMTGCSPFRRRGLAETLAQICIHRQVSPRELNSEIPESLSLLVDRLLEKDPDLRPQSAGELVTALEEILVELGGG